MPKLRALREKALLTQEELAEKSGVHAITISRIESGRTELVGEGTHD
jgi:transcriptional regulator with XRE-family HTH domain